MSEGADVIRRRIFREMLGERQLVLYEFLLTVFDYANGQQYHFLDMERFNEIVARDPQRGQRIYWQEMLARAHLAATTSAIRDVRWLHGCLDAASEGNYLIFCSAFRGLLEAAADSIEGLYRAPQCFAENSVRLRRILEGGDTGKEIFLSPELEDSLIHFSHARKKIALDKEHPESHRARQVREYMRILEEGKLENVIGCYSELCEVTHPSALSVLAYVQGEKTSDATVWKLDTDADFERIAEFVERYKPLMHELMMYVLNPILLTLYALEKFPSSYPRCPGVAEIDFSAIPAFQAFATQLQN